FRRKYDAQQVLARFAATARDETDLDNLTARLVEVVEETMQPALASLWLRMTIDHRQPTEAMVRSSSVVRTPVPSNTREASDES
ncbi:MAG TPA: hypothetical protein VF478_11300, partial [Anaerolineae bacterium]